jgi:hypothetical protein
MVCLPGRMQECISGYSFVGGHMTNAIFKDDDDNVYI